MNPALTLETPLGQAARENPATLRAFDRFGLDYCCHGHETLAQACARAQADPRAVMAAVCAEPPDLEQDADWSRATLAALCDHIVESHHAFVREVFAMLPAIMQRVVAAHGANHPEYLELAHVVTALRDEMLDHLTREERVLFPWLKRLESAGHVTGPPWSVRGPITCMIHDHDEVAAALEKINLLTNKHTAPANGCSTVMSLFRWLGELERDTRRHIHKENNILFPKGIEAEQRHLSRRAGTGDVAPCT